MNTLMMNLSSPSKIGPWRSIMAGLVSKPATTPANTITATMKWWNSFEATSWLMDWIMANRSPG